MHTNIRSRFAALSGHASLAALVERGTVVWVGGRKFLARVALTEHSKMHCNAHVMHELSQCLRKASAACSFCLKLLHGSSLQEIETGSQFSLLKFSNFKR